jgi:hypothetical protein
MIRLLDDVPANVLGVEATGTVTDEDYESVLVPAVRARLDAGEKLRFVYVLGAGFDGWTMGAMWEDAKLGVGDLTKWEKVAVVTDKDSIRHMVKAFGWMMPGDARVFELDELADATAWAAD